jgi:hypothetical protein
MPLWKLSLTRYITYYDESSTGLGIGLAAPGWTFRYLRDFGNVVVWIVVKEFPK